MMAISADPIRLRSVLVRRSTRAVPAPARSRRRASLRAKLLHLDMHVGDAGPDVVVDLGVERKDPRLADWGEGGDDATEPPDRHPVEVNDDHAKLRMAGWKDVHLVVEVPAVQV